MTLLIVLPPDGVLDQSGQLICSSVDGLVQGRCMVSDRDGLPAFEAGFHHAALVMLGTLVAALVGQMDLNSRNVIAQVAQRALHYSTDLGDQSLVAFDVMVGIDLNLHGILP